MSKIVERQLYFADFKAVESSVVQVSRRNSKLGDLPSFSLPAITTCPGRTESCKRLCYGLRGNFIPRKMRKLHKNNFEASKLPDFVDWMVFAIADTNSRVFRVHVVGDFYNVPYVRKWIEIANRCPHVRFFGSTRSWRVPALVGVIDELRNLPNVYLRASVDIGSAEQPKFGWGVWSIEGKGDPCPHDYGEVDSCYHCGKCWHTKATDISFKIKWTTLADEAIWRSQLFMKL